MQSKNISLQQSAAVKQQRKRYKLCSHKPEQYQFYRFIFAQQLIPVKSVSSTCGTLPKNEIRVRAIERHECQEVLDFLRLYYYLEEPLTAGSEPKQQDEADEVYTMSHINNGTCLVAVQNDDANSESNIVGVLISGPKGPDEAERLFEEAAKYGPTKMGHISQITACVERDANVYQRFGVKKVLHVHVLGVKKEMRGKNIGRSLIEEVLNKATSLNYDMVTSDCTSAYSAKLFKRVGFQCINIKYYKDYVDETGKQVFTPDAPHEYVTTVAFNLKTNRKIVDK